MVSRSLMRLLPGVLALLAGAFVLLTYYSYTVYNLDPNGCEMSWSRPIYVKLDGFTSRQSRMGSKYNIYLYREGGIDEPNVSVTGIPVLFIPGNAGSYRQARSIGSYFSSMAVEKGVRFDVFTADLMEDFTAFHGRTLLDQAQYLNDAIEYILLLYKDSSQPRPGSVIIIGHSMGGIVARTLVTLPNYIPGSINTILTLSTPHTLPPLTFDHDITVIYDKVNQYWRRAFGTETGPLSNMLLISITGGQSDNMVPSDYTTVSSIVPPTHGFTVFSYSVPFVWTGVDHLAMVWCHQLRKAVGDALFDIIDESQPGKTVQLTERIDSFRKYLFTGLEKDDDFAATTELVLDSWNGENTTISTNGTTFELTSNKIGYAIWHHDTMPEASTLVCRQKTSMVDDENSHINVVHFNRNPDRPTRLVCYDAMHHSAKLPLAQPTDQYPFESRRTLSLTITEPKDIVALVNDPGRIVSPRVVHSVNESLWRLYRSGKSLSITSAYSEISLLSLSSSLISYSVRLEHSPKCTPRQTYFQPFFRQDIAADPSESRIHVNVVNRPVTIFTHSPSPFVPYKEPVEKLVIQVFTPETDCQDGAVPYELYITVDLLASVGNLALRYRTLVATLPLAVSCMLLLIQLLKYNKGVFIGFDDAMNVLIRFPLALIILSLIVLYAVLGVEVAQDLLRLVQIPPERANVNALKAVGFKQNDIFLGTADKHLWLLGPIFLLVAIGLCYLVHYFVQLVLKLGVKVAIAIAKQQMTEKKGSVQEQTSRRRFAIVAAVWLLVLFLVPFQIAFLGAAIYQLFNSGRALYGLRTSESVEGMRTAHNLFNFSIAVTMLFVWTAVINAPLFIVWVHNLSLKWSIAFSSYRNILSVLPVLLLVDSISRGSMLPRMHSPLQRTFTIILITYIATYAVLHGFLHTFMLHHLVNYLSAWLMVIYLDDPGTRHRVGRLLRRGVV
jgi:glycosylphosphatidylinositol deacylase